MIFASPFLRDFPDRHYIYAPEFPLHSITSIPMKISMISISIHPHPPSPLVPLITVASSPFLAGSFLRDASSGASLPGKKLGVKVIPPSYGHFHWETSVFFQCIMERLGTYGLHYGAWAFHDIFINFHLFCAFEAPYFMEVAMFFHFGVSYCWAYPGKACPSFLM